MLFLRSLIKMKQLSYILISMFLIGSALAQGPVSGNDPKATQILKDVSAKYKKFKSIRANFAYTLESKANKVKETHKGILHLKGERFKVEIQGQEIICDGKTSWNYNKDANEVQVNTYNPAEGQLSPSQLFTMYEKGFLYKFIDEKNVKGKVLQQIELTPTDKNKKYFKVKLFVDKNAKQLVKSSIFDKNGNVYTYEITKFETDVKYEDSYFTFDPKLHPKCEVIDLRD